MKPVYVTKTETQQKTDAKTETITITKTELKHFICALKDGKNEKEELEFKNIDTIAQNAFMNATDIKEICFNENLKTIKKEAFENCGNFEVFRCEKKVPQDNSGADVDNNANGNSEDTKNHSIENFATAKIDDTFIIETSAFTKCKNLHTVILPDCKKLVIEKDAFDGCSSLRTVVCFAEEIDFTENPFESCPETLTFVGNKDENKTSELERFARENGYRFIDA